MLPTFETFTALIDNNYILLDANETFHKVFKLAGKHPPKNHIKKLTGKPCWKLLENSFNQALKGKTCISQIELPLQDKSRLYQITLTPVTIESQVIAVSLVATDLTEHILTKNKLEHAEGHYGNLLNGAHESIHVVDLETGKYINMNDAGLRLHNTTREEFQNLGFLQICAPVQEDNLPPAASFQKRLPNLLKTGVDKGTWLIIDPRTGEKRVLEYYANLINQRRHMRVMAIDITDRIKTEEALKKSEERYRVLVENASDMIHIIDGNTAKYISMNEASARTIGLSKAEYMQKTVFDVSTEIQPDGTSSLKKFQKAISDITKHGHKRDVWKVIKQDTGEERLLEFKATALGTDNHIHVTAQDITERQNTEQRLRDNEARYRMMTENRFEAITIVDPTTMKFYDGNQLNCDMFGISHDELLTLGPVDVSDTTQPPDDLPTPIVAKQYLEEVFAEGITSFEWRHKNLKTGEIFLCEVRLAVIPNIDPPLIRASVVDIRERKSSEDLLRQSEENLRITLDSIGDGVIATDGKGRITHMNPVAETLTGWPVNKAINKQLTKVFHIISEETEKPVKDPIAQVLQDGCISERQEGTILVSNKNERNFIALTSAPIQSTDSKIVGAVLVFRNETANRTIQKQLSDNEKMRAIGQLAGGVAHDFNNLLGIVSGAAQLVLFKEKGKLESKSENFLQSIINATKKASDLTNKLITFSRVSSTAKTPTSIHDSISQSIDLLSRTLNKLIKIVLKLEAKHAVISGNKTMIDSLIMNLAINASQAMEETGGTIEIHTKNLQLKKDETDLNRHQLSSGEYIEINIKDDGPGIPKENLDKIFEPFFTTKQFSGGTGLGLAAVYGTVHEHQGRIEVESEPGEGTRFRILFPVSLDQLEISFKTYTSNKITGKNILLIDDDPDIRETIGSMLEMLGFNVITAKDGQEGIDIFTAHKNEIDLIIADLNMPNMNGKKAIQQIHNIDNQCPIIVSSGFSEKQQMQNLEKLGIVGYMSKPYLMEDLQQMLAKIFNPE